MENTRPQTFEANLSAYDTVSLKERLGGLRRYL